MSDRNAPPPRVIKWQVKRHHFYVKLASDVMMALALFGVVSDHTQRLAIALIGLAGEWWAYQFGTRDNPPRRPWSRAERARANELRRQQGLPPLAERERPSTLQTPTVQPPTKEPPP